jgi:hypothetical protein
LPSEWTNSTARRSGRSHDLASLPHRQPAVRTMYTLPG